MNTKEKGFTILEILISLAILGIISVIAFSSLNSLSRRDVSATEALSVVSALNEARSLAISSKENDDFGVHFETSTITLFKGDTYNALDSYNKLQNVSSGVVLENITLNGGGSNVVFDRLTGRTNNYGTIDINSSTGEASSTVTIFATGLSQID